MADQPRDISAAELLTRLESEVAQKLQAIAGIRLALGLKPWSGAATPAAAGTELQREEGAPGAVRPDEFFRMSIPDAIRKFLGIMRKPMSPKAIADGLKAGGMLSNAKKFYSNITTAIVRLAETGTLVNTPNGWGLSEWYPNRPKAPESPKKGKNGKKKRPKPKPKTGNGESQATSEPSQKPPKKNDAYLKFISEARKAGKSMGEAARDWKAHKTGSG
jgi:hypothetical protein